MEEEIYGERSRGPSKLKITLLDEEDQEEAQTDDNQHVDSYDDDDEEEEDDDEEKEPVRLGVLEKPQNSWSPRRQLFPSKAGGLFGSNNLPTGRSCLCDFCGEPLQFMVEVYAPLTEKDSTFHRTLFLFMCTSMTCLLKDQHEQWKRNQDKPSRSANCPVITLFTPVSPRETMGKINLLMLELFFVAGVVPGKEIKFVVVAEEYITAPRNTRPFIGDRVIKDAAYPRACLRKHPNLVIIELLGRCKKLQARSLARM